MKECNECKGSRWFLVHFCEDWMERRGCETCMGTGIVHDDGKTLSYVERQQIDDRFHGEIGGY